MSGSRGHGGGAAGSAALAAVGLAAVAGFALGSLVLQRVLPDTPTDDERRRRRPAHERQPSLQRSQRSLESCRAHRVRPRASAASRLVRAPPALLADALPLAGLHTLPHAAVLTALRCLDLASACRLARVHSSWARTVARLVRDRAYLQACAWHGTLAPPGARAAAWRVLLREDAARAASAHLYAHLVRVPDDAVPCCASIRRDLHRTLPEALAGSGGRRRLFRLLKAYAAADPDVGYCQGMNFVAGFLLTLTDDDEHAFFLLDVVMQRFEARWMYTPGLPHLALSLWQLERLISVLLPRLHAHLAAISVQPQLYASEWFVGLFAYTLTLEDTARVWDVFLTHGWKALHRVALAYLALFQPTLLELGFEQVVRYIKTAPREGHLSIDEVFRVAQSLKVTNSMLDALEAQYYAELDLSRRDAPSS